MYQPKLYVLFLNISELFRPIILFSRINTHYERDGIDYELASESPLRLCGYNVSQSDGLASATRQFLLAKIIHDEIMSKLDVIHYLEQFINRNGAKEANSFALEKWCEDLDFVHQYNKGIQPKTYIQSLKEY